MADALCGPSNPLQNFQKHTAVDRTLQQDRLTARSLPSQGFRSSPGANAGALDAEFEAFQAGFTTGPHLPDPQLFHHANAATFTNPASSSHIAPGWASDFQRLNLAGEQLPATRYQFSPQASLPHNVQQYGVTATGPQHSRMSTQQEAPYMQMLDAQPRMSDFTSLQLATPEWHQRGNMSMMNSSQLPGQPMYINGTSLSTSTTQHNRTQPQVEDVFDDAAFERAFDAARSDMQEREQQWQQENVELGQDVLINESARSLLQSDHLVEQELIGADTILHEAQEEPKEDQQNDDPDELARTAGQLLDSVKFDQSQKFQESNFLALMRRLRDREVRVEGDKMVDATQPLHPGGKYYPGNHTDTTMSGAIDSTDNEPAITLSPSQDPSAGSSVAVALTQGHCSRLNEVEDPYTDPPQQSPIFFAPSSSSAPPSPRPPPFSSLYFLPQENVDFDRFKPSITGTDSTTLLAFAPTPPFESSYETSFDTLSAAEAETKAALPADTKGESSGKSADDGEPPPPYTEGSSPLDSFTYVMAAAGGAASIITQVQQGGGPPINTLGDVGADEHITLDLRGTRFTLSRDELLTLPEFVLLSLFPNGLLPDGHMNSFHEGDIYPVDYDPASLQYMLDFFRNVAQTIPSDSPSPTTSPDEAVPMEAPSSSARDMLQDRAGIIVLREDLDFYAIPPRADIEQPEMIEVKRAAGKALLKQDGIFSGLRRSEETGTTEQHLIEMLTAGGFNNDDRWGHRASEPNKAVICSLALARLRTDIKGNDLANSNAVGMAQKLLLFWRKPARRCWWEGIELENVDGVEGKLKVWIRRVWTLEMVCHIFFPFSPFCFVR
ncbi:hypothetical protein MMC16_004388 [Acarospora aff. strigata]|nr:hypothetical protein [Acarospora aff. strigata]